MNIKQLDLAGFPVNQQGLGEKINEIISYLQEKEEKNYNLDGEVFKNGLIGQLDDIVTDLPPPSYLDKEGNNLWNKTFQEYEQLSKKLEIPENIKYQVKAFIRLTFRRVLSEAEKLSLESNEIISDRVVPLSDLRKVIVGDKCFYCDKPKKAGCMVCGVPTCEGCAQKFVGGSWKTQEEMARLAVTGEK